MTSEAELLATSLQAKSTGAGKWQAQCPYHDDKKPSLSIQAASDGKTLVHCHAGCEDVFERLIADGYILRRSKSIEAEKPDATYQYVSADGELLFEMLRFPDKRFRARRPDGGDGWSWKVPNDLRVLYRLPDVIRAGTDQLIFIVEGEKDADKLAKHGYVATTNPFGAGKWREHYNEYFVGRHIVIVPDNDEPGRNHAEQVRAQLESAAASVRVLSLENEVAEKGDISDLIDAQGIDSFKRLLESLPPAHSKPKPYLTLSDLHRLPRREWLVDGLIPQKAVALLYGDSGVGKSFIALDLCVRIATGQPAHGRDTKQGLAIYVALEGHAGLCDRLRAAAVLAGQQSMSKLKVGIVTRPLDLCSGDSVTGLLAAIRTAASDFAVRPTLVVIDTLSRAMPGANENSPDDMNRAIGALTRIQKETGATVLTVHHSGKTTDRGARGHSSLRAAMDTELLVTIVKGVKYLKVTKQRDGEDQIKFRFELTPAQVPGSDQQGMVETRVVTPGGQSSDDARAPLSRQAGGFKKALEAALSASSRRASEEEAEQLGVPAGTAVVTKDEWLEQARGMKLSTSDQSLSRALNRARTALSDADLLRQAGDLYWLPQSSGILGRPGRGPGQARTGRT